MGSDKAQRIIFGLMASVTVIYVIGDVMSGRNRVVDIIPRRMTGATIGGIALMLLAVPAPRLAVGFAGVTAVASLYVSDGGQAIIDGLANVTGTAPQESRVSEILAGGLPPGGADDRTTESPRIVGGGPRNQ